MITGPSPSRSAGRLVPGTNKLLNGMTGKIVTSSHSNVKVGEYIFSWNIKEQRGVDGKSQA
jgi:hypothetical protein